VYLLDRQTGKPLYPIEERPVPQTDLAGEKTYPTQPFPTAPPNFAKHGITRDDLTDISPEAHAYALEKTKDFRFGPMFTPPGKRETLAFPGFHGGALWGGASYDPQSEWLFVNHNEISWSTAIEDADPKEGYRYGFNGYHMNVDEQGYPITRPPWGRISAIDLKNAKIVWQTPHGEFPGLTKRGIPRTGTYIRGGNVVTKGGVVFAAGTLDSMLRAYEAKTGKILWETYLGGASLATPTTYMIDGKQYVVAGVSDNLSPEKPTETGPYKAGDFVAFALPQG
jgi:glucose dehydrogenase